MTRIVRGVAHMRKAARERARQLAARAQQNTDKPFRCAICEMRYATLGARERCMDMHGAEYARDHGGEP